MVAIPNSADISNPVSEKIIWKNRMNNAKPAAFGATERKAVTGVGAPSYTSGVQK